MDGRIDGVINKRTLASEQPHSGMTAKRPKLELSSKVEICSDVTPKFSRPSLLITLPDKARTLSSADSSLSGPSHSFDFCFVNSDDEVRQLLLAQTGDKLRDVILISHPDDLSQANLVSRLSISDDGRHTLHSGKLFEGSQPLTLVMDIRKLTSEDLPKFNDLLDPDNPCLYDNVSQKKRPLGEHVTLLVMADPAQLASVGQRHDTPRAAAPGADFWRRINRPGNTWQFDAQTNDDSSMDINEVPPLLAEFPSAESAMDDGDTVLIDCHLHTSWRQLLLGGPGVDKQGRIQHIPGRLETLRAGQRVILKGANWQDLAFEQSIRQMLAQKCFESNGKICQLPDDVEFYQMPIGNNELHSLFQSLSHSVSAAKKPIIINQSNISQWLNPIAIAPEGHAVPNNCLLEQVRAGGAVTVTSPLTEVLWFRLLGSLQTIRETTSIEPRLQMAHTRRQPKALGLAENHEHSVEHHTTFDTITYRQHAQASYWVNHQKSPLVIQVNEQTSLSQLFDNIYISSEQKAHFGRRQTELQKALTSGKHVLLRGLESNPTLQQLLEPLAVGQPLLINGQLQAYPKAHVTLLWPESAKSPSSVFSSMVAKSKPCPEVNIWDINAVKHDIPRAGLPEQALHQLYEAFTSVSGHLCNPLPEISEGLLNNLILAARRAQQVDQSSQLLPCHWRKAINSVITHGTRQNPSVRDFMKVACWHLLPDAHKTSDKNQTASVDPDRLNAIINSAPVLDRAFVKQNLWPLARALDPAVFKGNEFEGLQLSYECPFPSSRAEGESLDRLCAIIVAHAPEQQRHAMAYQLAVDPSVAELHQPSAIRPSSQIKRLEDALASGWQLPLPPGQTRSDAIQTLATDCFYIARTANSDAAGIEHTENRLSQSLKWTGSTDKPLSALAHDLYHSKMSQKDRESRRLSRLHDRLADSPVIFLQGETGTGKSYFSARMAKASGQASVISLGPSDSEQTLIKRWRWQEHADGDRSMEEQNRALMEWAKTPACEDEKKDEHPVGEKYVTLILDEANLTKTGLLASLNGLWEPQPCIYVNGHPVKVSSKHRVILTGNPDHYVGRQLDPALKEKLPRAYYPRLDKAFLRDRVVEPALVKQLQRHLPDHPINTLARSATKSVMTLWLYYQELLPEHEFTPRDLTDICSWVGWYLDCALPVNNTVTGRQINGLIQQSFRDVLGYAISETHQDALTALEIWFAARYEPDKTLSDKVHIQTLRDIQQAFKTVTQRTRPDFDTSGSAVCELVQRLGQDLSRCQQAYHLHRKHDGRQATLIEGPAGRGKDATLNLAIQSVKQQAEQRGESMPKVFHLNACDCSWNKVCEKIQTAKVHGGIVVISEMNLIDSQHLEGELNDILAGDAHPGFHLFATINPPEYSGRKPLSPALKGRFRHLPIRQYSLTELQAIAEKVLPDNPQGKILAKQLTLQHCHLRAYLQQQNLPLQPTGLDLQNVARAVIRRGDFSQDGLHQCLNQHYRLYLMAAKIPLEKLPESSALTMSNGVLDSGLCKWFNQAVSDVDRPWLIRRSYLNSIDEKRHEIRIKAELNGEEARAEIIKSVARTRWLASGLSLKPDQSDDILTQALYRHWQQRWFDRKFGETGTDANSVFCLTEEQALTLKLSVSQPHLREAEKRIEAWNSNAVRLWPGFWHQISDLSNHWVDDSEKYKPEVEEKHAPALDRGTKYEGLELPTVCDYKIFNTQKYPSHMYRCQVIDTYVTAKGDVKLIEISDQHIQGFETLMPARLPGRDQEMTLASDQTLATFEVSPKNGQYALPSLTPNDYIVALRIEPDLAFTLVRNRYTGLHRLSIPEAKANQSFQVAYVLEPRGPGEKTPAKKTLPERSLHFDTHCSEGMKTVLNKLFRNTDQNQGILWKIKSAKDTKQRIEAITDYCQNFSGEAQPERWMNFFQFLVTRRQGSCRHRVPVFIAFCRYYGIPSRQVDSLIHSFAEYSGDGGRTWESVDLGGAPLEPTEITSDFQTTRKVCASGTESRNIKDLLKDVLKGADLTQQQILAEANGMSLEELKKVLETHNALPGTNPSTSDMVKNLWKKKDLTGFSVGVSMLVSMGLSMLLETEASGNDDQELADDETDGDEHIYKLMSEAVREILSKNDEDQVSEQLKSLHSKIIDQTGASPHEWLRSIVDILKHSDLTKPSVIHFAREALESGWLDAVTTPEGQSLDAHGHHQLLVRLEGIDELKVEAAHCLKKWYKELLSRGKNSQIWQSAYQYFQKEEGGPLFITHDHDGFSKFLENKVANPSLQTTWTDEPKGVPNIERMLVYHPAFSQLTSSKAHHRPVIVLGQPDWYRTMINQKVEALLAENSPNLKQLLEKINQDEAVKEQRPNALQAFDSQCDLAQKPDIEGKYKPILESLELPLKNPTLVDDLKYKAVQSIHQAFTHYLYRVTHSKGGCLTYCWVKAAIGDSTETDYYGAYDPSSPEELFLMMCNINSSLSFQNSVKDANLQQALNVSNALVLRSDELTTIAEEFVSSVNLNSICDSLVQVRTVFFANDHCP